MCKVSVVIPVYNAEAYLRQCLDSVKAQTLQEIGVICINDGSTDRSESMIQDYVLSDQRFSLISQKNGGLSACITFRVGRCLTWLPGKVKAYLKR